MNIICFKVLEYGRSDLAFEIVHDNNRRAIVSKQLTDTLNIRPNDIIDVADHCSLC